MLGGIVLGHVLRKVGREHAAGFHTIRWAASDELTMSTAWILLEYSWPMRLNTRSAPVRSTRTATPGYFASNARATLLGQRQVDRSYQTTLPSFLAAAISSGVIVLAGGAADKTCACAGLRPPDAASTLDAASAVEGFQDIAPGQSPHCHGSSPGQFLVVRRGLVGPLQPLKTRQRSGGR